MIPTKLGISGRIARAFLTTEITPLLALTGLLLGLFAIFITPREEEPQINVTFANVFIAYPGASAKEVESLVTTPAERIVSELAGVENIYSMSSPGMSVITVRFEVGEPRTDAIVRLYNAFYSNQDWLPPNSGVGMPLIKPMGIDDVPVVASTLWSEDPNITPADLTRIARTLATELQRVPGTRDITLIGEQPRILQVAFDPQRLAAYELSLADLQRVLGGANSSVAAGSFLGNGQLTQVQAGSFLQSVDEVSQLVVGVYQGAPVFLGDIAEITDGAEQPARYVSFGTGTAAQTAGVTAEGRFPAITLAVAKKPGANAVEVAEGVIARFEQMRGVAFPDTVQATVTRNYGATAEDKAQTLIKKLIFATLSVVALVLFTLGKREALVVGAAVIVTLAITLFASWAWGFTLNRVSLFALIFSIGILVDDAIVVVENIHRHQQLGGKSLLQSIPAAVDEVGGPTILATFTVIAALLPMAFVTGLMGPYMRPIPINASTGMLISLAVAFIFTPWLYLKLFNKQDHQANHESSGQDLFLQRVFRRLMLPFLRAQKGNRNRWLLLVGLLLLIGGSMALVSSQAVIMKMLPFDNKSELQILVDMPEGAALEDTHKVLQALADHLDTVAEVTHYQLYAGSSAPVNFNGLVRQYYLRAEPHQGDIQVNLLDKSLRNRKSHDIALELRPTLTKIGGSFGADIKIVEVPPGPPVMAPLVAEIYGPHYAGQLEMAGQIKALFHKTENLVEADDSAEAHQEKIQIRIDRARAALLGVNQKDITDTIAAALSGSDMAYLHDEKAQYPVPVRVVLPAEQRMNIAALNDLRVRAAAGNLVPLAEVTQIQYTTRDQTIHRKDLQPVVYVTGDIAGGTDSPLYGLASINSALAEMEVEQFFIEAPENPYQWSLKWDGEWQVTFETFRDMGAAYAVGLILIYLLVVAQFRSYGVPLIIMAPIPLTMIGILPGHALLSQQFTAPSMIGMIALAGIIVRNSILLVDFIQQEVAAGKPLQEATLNAAAVRAKPIALTAIAAMMGGFFILDDPIFGGLAVSLIFGLMVSTLLTLVVIPVVYYHYHWKEESGHLRKEAELIR